MPFTRHFRRVAAATLVSAVAAVGCGGSSSPPPAMAAAPAASTPADDPNAGEALTNYDRHHHHGGVTLLIAMSLDVVGVMPDQKTTIEQIQADLHKALEPARIAEKAVLAALADGIAAGTIDKAKVDAAIAQLAMTAGAAHDASVAALDQLHGILTAPQRAAFADKVQAHWDVWQDANALESPAEQAQAERDRLATLAADLSLAPDQIEKIRADAASTSTSTPPLDAEEIGAYVRRFCDAFRGEMFDARSLTTASSADSRVAAWGAKKMALFLEAATPVLTPEQRTKLAQSLREHAEHDPMMQGA